MNKVYSDASFDSPTGFGAYCIVVVPHGGKADWYVKDCLGGHGSNDIETAGLREAILVAHDLSLKNQRQSAVFCDSLSSIQALSALARNNGVALQHIPAHTVGKEGGFINDDIKRQHWADIMVHRFLADHVSKLDK